MRLLQRQEDSLNRGTEMQRKAQPSPESPGPLRPGGRRRSLREIHDDQTGQATVEYMLILIGFIIPLIYFLNLLLDVLVVHYRTVSFLETLPFP